VLRLITSAAWYQFNSDKGRRKLQRLVNFKFAGSVDILFKNADTDGVSCFRRRCLHMMMYRHCAKFGRWSAPDSVMCLFNASAHLFFLSSISSLVALLFVPQDGELDFDEFSAILKRHRLEQFFPRKEQRDVFKAMDKDHSNKVQS
jgi:hypothetical protein